MKNNPRRIGRWGTEVRGVEKPGVLMQIRGGTLHYGKIRILESKQIVDDADTAIRRLLNGEEIWVFQFAKLITTIQRRLEQILTEPVAGD